MTSGLIVDIPTLVAHRSGILTLFPGDLIFTGPPSGVGLADGRYLAPGDLLESSIEGIGSLPSRGPCPSRPRRRPWPGPWPSGRR